MKRLNKLTTQLLLAGIILLGSFITFYAGNLLCSDLSNMFYGLHDNYIISSLPLSAVVLYFVLGFIFLIRFYRYPEYKKALINLYTILGAIVGLIGVVTSILSGTIIYHNFLAPYPFAGYSVIMLIVNLLALASCVVINILTRKKMENDTEKKKIKVRYALFSVLLFVLLILAFYRFGSVLWMPVYVQLRTFDLTIWFYIWVMIPLAVIVHIVFYFFDVYKSYKHAVIYTSIVFGLHVVLGIVVVVLMKNNPEFISAISPALPLERLATMPLDTYIGLFGVGLIALYYVIYSVRSYLIEKKK